MATTVYEKEISDADVNENVHEKLGMNSYYCNDIAIIPTQSACETRTRLKISLLVLTSFWREGQGNKPKCKTPSGEFSFSSSLL